MWISCKNLSCEKTALSLASCIQMVFGSINTDSHMWARKSNSTLSAFGETRRHVWHIPFYRSWMCQHLSLDFQRLKCSWLKERTSVLWHLKPGALRMFFLNNRGTLCTLHYMLQICRDVIHMKEKSLHIHICHLPAKIRLIIQWEIVVR